MSNTSTGVAAPTEPDPQTATQHLSGHMGTWKLVFLVLAFNAPFGIMAAVVPLVIGFGGGVVTPLLILATAVFLLIFAVGFTAMARKLPRAGAFYTFITAGLGRPVGLGGAFIAVVTYSLALLGTIPFLGISMDGLLSSWGGGGTPWWLWAAIATVIIGVLTYFRIDVSARVLGVIVSIEAVFIIIFNIVVASNMGGPVQFSLEAFNPTSLIPGGAVIGLLFAFTAFGGFESTAIYRDEVRNPVKTVPRATYIAIIVMAVFYAVGAWFVIMAIGGADGVAGLQDPSVAYMGAVLQFQGPLMFQLGSILLIMSTFASLTALVNVLARYLFNLGTDGILPRALGVPHPRFGSPHRATTAVSLVLLVGIAIAALTGLSALVIYSTFLGMAGFALASLLLLAAIAIVVYLVRTPFADLNVWQRFIAPLVALVLMAIFWILVVLNIDLQTGSPTLSAIALSLPVAALVAGVIIGLVLRKRNPAVYAKIGTRE